MRVRPLFLSQQFSSGRARLWPLHKRRQLRGLCDTPELRCIFWNNKKATQQTTRWTKFSSRREFIACASAAAAWPIAARGQQSDRLRHLGVLMATDENDPDLNAYLAQFKRTLVDFGWLEGRNLQIEVHWAGVNVDRVRMHAKALVDLQPDLIFAYSTPATAALQRETRTIPILFAVVGNPVGDGFVASLALPGGNITGFMAQEASLAGKWLELLTEIAPDLKRAAVIFNPETAPGGGTYFVPEFETAAARFRVASIRAPVHSDADLETVITSLGHEPGAGVVVTPDVFTINHRASIISLASRSNVPVVYRDAINAKEGGLLSYGPDIGDIFHRAASYVDRILRGAPPAELPVQLPVKFQMTLNMKTAKALGLDVPLFLQQRADEVIE
jgi:ABC-type uncharacterized transport system substrate-binding protein